MSLITHEFKIETAYAEALNAAKGISGRAWKLARIRAFKRFIDSLDDDFKGLRLYEADGMRVSEAAALVRLGIDPDGLATTLVVDIMAAENEMISGYSIHDEENRYPQYFVPSMFLRGLISRYAMEQGLPGKTWPKREKPVEKGEKTVTLKVDDWLTEAYENNLVYRIDFTCAIESALTNSEAKLVHWKHCNNELTLTFNNKPPEDTYSIRWCGTDRFTPEQSKELATLGALRVSRQQVLPVPRSGDTSRFMDYVRTLGRYVASLSELLWETALGMRDVERLHYLRQQNGVRVSLPQVDNRTIDLKLLKGLAPADQPRIFEQYDITGLMNDFVGSGSEVDRSIIGELMESRLIGKPLTCSHRSFVTRYTDSLLISIDRTDPGLIIEGTGGDILDSLYKSTQTLSSDMMPGDMVELHYMVMVADSGKTDFRHLFKRAKHNLGVINSYTNASLNRLAGSGRTIKLSDVIAKAKPNRESSIREFATALVERGAKVKAEMSPCWCKVQLEREMEGRKEVRRNPAELLVDVAVSASGLRAKGNVLSSADSRYVVSKDNNAVLHIAAEDQSEDRPDNNGDVNYLKGPLAGISVGNSRNAERYLPK